MCGKCLEDVWMVTEWCMMGVWSRDQQKSSWSLSIDIFCFQSQFIILDSVSQMLSLGLGLYDQNLVLLISERSLRVSRSLGIDIFHILPRSRH